MASSSASHSSPVRSAYFIHGGGVAPSNIDTSLFTHLYYAFASMDTNSYNIITDPSDNTGYISTFSATVRKANPAIKTLLAIGGANSNAASFSRMAASREGRAAFINSSISVARSFGFDGLDLDWEFPSSPADMTNLAYLIAEWREAANKQSLPLLLTAAAYYSVTIDFGGVPRTYPAATMAKYLDWVTIMAYDLYGSWVKNRTCTHTALYDNAPNQIRTVDYGVRQWLAAQLPPSSALLGLAAYGHTWFLVDPAVNGVGAPASDYNTALTFSDINGHANGQVAVDRTTVTAYCSWIPGPGQRTIWAGFDNPATIASKVRYLREKGLRGYAFWRLGGGTNNLLYRQASQTLLT